MPTLLTALVVAFCALVLAAPTASAAEVFLQDSIAVCDPSAGCGDGDVTSFFELSGEAGEDNQLTMRARGRLIVVKELSGAPLRVAESSDGCRLIDTNTVRCRAGGPLEYSEIDLGDGNDTALIDGMDGAASGGPGDDEIRVLDASVSLAGEPGADRMVATGSGALSVSYSDRREPLMLSVDGAANDGAEGEGDEISGNVESLRGGAGDDLLVAGDSPSRLYGEAGDDKLSGGPRSDFLEGGRGADRLSGGDGSDTVDYEDARSGVRVTMGDAADDGAAGEGDFVAGDIENATGSFYDDRLFGTRGANILAGGSGSDLIIGRRGPDSLSAGYDFRSKRDRVLPGPGRDLVTEVERFDRVELRDRERDEVHCRESVPELTYDRGDRFRECAPELGMNRNGFSVKAGDAVFDVRCPRAAQIPCRGVAVVVVPSGRRWKERFGPLRRGQRATLRIDAGLRPNGRRATVLLRTSRSRPRSVTVGRNTVRLF